MSDGNRGITDSCDLVVSRRLFGQCKGIRTKMGVRSLFTSLASDCKVILNAATNTTWVWAHTTRARACYNDASRLLGGRDYGRTENAMPEQSRAEVAEKDAIANGNRATLTRGRGSTKGMGDEMKERKEEEEEEGKKEDGNAERNVIRGGGQRKS